MNRFFRELLAGVIALIFLASCVFVSIKLNPIEPASTNGLFVGEVVKVKKGLSYTDFYNKECKKRTVKGLQAVDDANLAWVLLENCSWTGSKYFMVTLDQKELEKAE